MLDSLDQGCRLRLTERPAGEHHSVEEEQGHGHSRPDGSGPSMFCTSAPDQRVPKKLPAIASSESRKNTPLLACALSALRGF